MSTEQANQTWRLKGDKTKESILEILKSNPGVSLYAIGKKLNLSASTISHHIESLVNDEQLIESISLVKNKAMKSYEMSTDDHKAYRLYIEDSEILEWKPESKIYLYLIHSGLIKITPKFVEQLNSQSLFCLTLKLQRDKEDLYVIIPDNVISFYKINDPNYNCEFDQTIVEDDDSLKAVLLSIKAERKPIELY